jgi:chorismate mutase/prephenate dehydratase
MTTPNEPSQETLDELRQRIDALDQQLIESINARARLVVEVGRIKRALGIPIYTPHRESEVLRRILAHNRGPMPPRAIEAIYRELMSASFALERPLRIGYLGPLGTYSHLAARRQFGSSVEYEDLRAIEGVFEEVAREHVDYGLVPIENSIGGGITDTLDAFLTYHRQVQIYGEVQLAVHFSLLTQCQPHDIRRIYSRGEAFTQCRGWLATQYPHVERIAVESTAVAVRRVREDYDRDPHSGSAAIGSTLAGELYDVPVLFEKVEDRQGNITRFLILSKSETQPTGDDKTSIMLTTADRPGSLVDVLSVFKRSGINLTHIDKRPSREVNWDYTFFIDALGHQRDARFAEVIGEARAHCKQLHVLGSYPRSKQTI